MIDEQIVALMAEHGIPGLGVLVARGGASGLARGYGRANVELDVPVTADTVFAIASLTKLFTAQAVLLLVEAGQVALDAPVRTYLPDLPAAWDGARVRHLLNHTGGIPNYTDVPAYWETTRLDVPRAQILGLVRDQPLQFAPGADWAYSNTGYYLLGLLIEAVSGQPYADFLAARIFAPLGMAATRANDPYAPIPGRAAGYTRPDGTLRNAAYYSPSGTYAAGVLLSTVADLARWVAALSTDALLPQRTLAAMWTPDRPPTATEARLGFTVGWGWFVFPRFGDAAIGWAGHNGSIVGFSSTILHFLAAQLTVVLLLNRDGFDRPDRLAAPLAAALLAETT